ncbi:hypothetical protein [Enterobacter sp.]|uniref:hypothetical protein n=1 Tax=Enterobacter sp. TaxID=42895 RepID=UPI00296E6E20|nr:hypothetical protein [Enterobacter sp.]
MANRKDVLKVNACPGGCFVFAAGATPAPRTFLPASILPLPAERSARDATQSNGA